MTGAGDEIRRALVSLFERGDGPSRSLSEVD
jgi:hypothetical protein